MKATYILTVSVLMVSMLITSNAGRDEKCPKECTECKKEEVGRGGERKETLADRTRDFVNRPLENSSLCTAARSHFSRRAGGCA